VGRRRREREETVSLATRAAGLLRGVLLQHLLSPGTSKLLLCCFGFDPGVGLHML
jgi:hypothetical protein